MMTSIASLIRRWLRLDSTDYCLSAHSCRIEKLERQLANLKAEHDELSRTVLRTGLNVNPEYPLPGKDHAALTRQLFRLDLAEHSPIGASPFRPS